MLRLTEQGQRKFWKAISRLRHGEREKVMLFLDGAERKDKDGWLFLQRFDVSVTSHPLEFNALNKALDHLTARDVWYIRIGEEEGDTEIKGRPWLLPFLYFSVRRGNCAPARS